MKNLLANTILIFLFVNCDPVSDMEATIENLTSQELNINFISINESLNKSLQILPNESALFQEGFDVGNTFLQASLIDYDSVVVRNSSDAILKIYKENNPGKNIYNVNDDWIGSEPMTKFFRYKYEIKTEDIAQESFTYNILITENSQVIPVLILFLLTEQVQ